VPAVQVTAASRLFRAGILLKSPTALERLATVDTIVFDKTGTLTEPVPALVQGADAEALRVAASVAAGSRHPLARSLLAAAGPVAVADGVVEYPGQGVRAGDVWLGRHPSATPSGPELWLVRPDREPVCFRFAETLRADAVATVQRLRLLGFDIHLLSGDNAAAVAPVAQALGIVSWRAGCTPVAKVAAVEALVGAGRNVLMVGDGLNDGPSLAAATVSASPSTAADVSQTVADAVFQGHCLAPVAVLIETARRARSVMWQNLALSIGYNVLMVPLAVAGFVTPWLAAVAMSSSSLLVMANSFRLRSVR
jgi:Cu2+-exporting ATPase